VYNGYPAGSQKCLAHLRRHFKKVASWVWQQPALGQEFLDLIDEALNIGSGEKPGCELIKMDSGVQVTEHPAMDWSSRIRGG